MTDFVRKTFNSKDPAEQVEPESKTGDLVIDTATERAWMTFGQKNVELATGSVDTNSLAVELASDETFISSVASLAGFDSAAVSDLSQSVVANSTGVSSNSVAIASLNSAGGGNIFTFLDSVAGDITTITTTIASDAASAAVGIGSVATGVADNSTAISTADTSITSIATAMPKINGVQLASVATSGADVTSFIDMAGSSYAVAGGSGASVVVTDVSSSFAFTASNATIAYQSASVRTVTVGSSVVHYVNAIIEATATTASSFTLINPTITAAATVANTGTAQCAGAAPELNFVPTVTGIATSGISVVVGTGSGTGSTGVPIAGLAYVIYTQLVY